MARQKSNMKKIQEGRCQGIGPAYVPFYLASEAKSMGTASMIPDEIEGRMIHTLSTTETDFYWLLRWSDDTLHIREQYLLNRAYVNDVRISLGLKQVPANCCYTTDFLVDLIDGSQRAYSVKFKAVSQMIIGVHVGLQNNSFSGFCNLMMSLLEPHKNQTELVGVSCTDAEFPSCVLPREIHADHGSEYESKALQKAMQELGITVSLVPVAAGSFKGGVENVFMRLQHVLRLTLQKDGYIMSDENGPKNARKQACLTLKDMRAIVYKIVLDLNTRLLPGYSPSIEMLDAKIKLSPAEIWKFEMKRSGSPICVTNSNRQQILFALLSRDRKFKITRAGIEYVGHKLIYFVDEQWFTTMIREKNPECEIRYDDLSVKQIYVRYKKQIHVVSLSVKREELATFERLSWNEYDALFTELKQRQKEERYEDLGRRIETEDFIHHTAKIARPLQEAENDTKNIKENRLLETQKLRVEKTELRNRQLQAFHKDADTKAELEEIVETPVLETKTDDSTDVYGFLGDDDE